MFMLGFENEKNSGIYLFTLHWTLPQTLIPKSKKKEMKETLHGPIKQA